MQIYWIRTHASRRVLALVKHLGLDADCIEVDMRAGGLRTPSYLALNPNSKAPTLVDGDVTLWESSAIMAYLCVKTDSDLWPVQRPAEQIEILSLAVVERLPLVARGGNVLLRVRHQARTSFW